MKLQFCTYFKNWDRFASVDTVDTISDATEHGYWSWYTLFAEANLS